MLDIGRILESTSRAVATLAGLALFTLAATPASAQTPVEFGDTITEPGVYYLRGNQTGSGTGIKIESSDVALLLSRFTLRGDGTDAGIFSSGNDNVAIYGGRITNFKIGIFLGNGEYCTVKDMRIDHCLALALDLARVDESDLVRLRCDNNLGFGLAAVNCYENRYLSIISHDNGADGLLIANEVAGGDEYSGNKIKLCWASYNGRDGIRIRDSRDNDISRNQCVHNSDAGIRLDTSLKEADPTFGQILTGADDNDLTSNWCVFNDQGIVSEWNASNNTLTNNTALANFEGDLVENNDSPLCDNTWFLNFFFFRDGDGEACIF